MCKLTPNRRGFRVLEAECTIKPPANSSFMFQVGWLHAEVHLKQGGSLDAEPGASWSEAKRDGFVARIEREMKPECQPIQFERRRP